MRLSGEAAEAAGGTVAWEVDACRRRACGATMRRADAAAVREGEEKQTDAIGEGLAAVAYALLDVAHAIREHTEATQ
jgi:hypothetical protein